MTPQSILTTVLIAASLGCVFGWVFGHKRGRAVGWNEFYFQRVDADRAKRDSQGRFKGKARA